MLACDLAAAASFHCVLACRCAACPANNCCAAAARRHKLGAWASLAAARDQSGKRKEWWQQPPNGAAMSSAQARAGKTKTGAAPNMAPATINTIRVALDDISIDQDSGWRDLDSERVSELKDAFKNGDSGLGILAIPSLLEDKISAIDGRRCLNNGKATVAALKALMDEWKVAFKTEPSADTGVAVPPDLEWASGQLLAVFEEGLRVDVVRYPSDDRDLVTAWNGLAHDVDSNKYRATTLDLKIRIVNAQRARVAGGDWNLTVKALLAIYGASKRGTIYRWINAAKALSEAVLGVIRPRKDMLQGYVAALLGVRVSD